MNNIFTEQVPRGVNHEQADHVARTIVEAKQGVPNPKIVPEEYAHMVGAVVGFAEDYFTEQKKYSPETIAHGITRAMEEIGRPTSSSRHPLGVI